MKEDTLFGRKVAQALEERSEILSPKVEARLAAIRQQALACQKTTVAEPQAAHGKVGTLVIALFGQEGSTRRRSLVAMLALLTGLLTAFYWQQVNESVDEMEAVDSELLADDLPPDAFLDKGFTAWLSRSQDNSSAQ